MNRARKDGSQNGPLPVIVQRSTGSDRGARTRESLVAALTSPARARRGPATFCRLGQRQVGDAGSRCRTQAPVEQLDLSTSWLGHSQLGQLGESAARAIVRQVIEAAAAPCLPTQNLPAAGPAITQASLKQLRPRTRANASPKDAEPGRCTGTRAPFSMPHTRHAVVPSRETSGPDSASRRSPSTG